MPRFPLLVVFMLAVGGLCQEVEIGDDEPATPNPPTTEEPKPNESTFTGSPDMSALLSFITPPLGLKDSAGPVSLVAGKPASLLVSLENMAIGDAFTLYALQAALHYPRYFSYHIQNFTTQRLQNTLEPKQQASLLYTFIPATQLAGQQFDLSVVLTYQDKIGKPYNHALLNETVAILEDEEGVDMELMFLCVIVLGVAILFVVFIWHRISNKTSRRQGNSANVSTGGSAAAVNEYMVKKTAPQSSSVDRSDGNMKRRQNKKQGGPQ